MEPFAEYLSSNIEEDLPSVMDREAWTERARELIEEVEEPGLVMSDESLSWIYHEDEIERLLDLFEEWEVAVVCYVRHPHTFRDSYRWMTSFMTAWTPEPKSVYYSEPDSWIYDYEYRLDRWRRHLGRRNVISMSYSACMERDGSIIPSFLDLLGVDPPPPDEIADYHLNSSG